jgi:molecular chaperone HtpG
MNDTATARTEHHTFQAEVSRLLHLMVHSVYSNKDIFLRELVSNAADACEKLRFLSLSEPALIAGDEALAVTITPDAASRRLEIEDNGIGMSHAELVDNLGTIARSGTRTFLDGLADTRDGGALIGQFGVGFYSAFMVASRVRVVSRRAGSDDAFAWESDGQGAFTVEPVEASEAPHRGTRVVLSLAEDASGYADEATVERIVRAYSAHVPIPVRIVGADGSARPITDGSALWMKPKASVTAEAYKDFYGTVADAFDEPALTVHYRAEGRNEFSVLLFVPSQKPFDLFDPARRGRVKLYVRRVFITDEAEILPGWLRFVRGVVDSEDLPLNISREMLQKNPILEAIGRNVTGRMLTEIARLADSDPATFETVFTAFGPVLKEGLYEAPERRDELFGLVRFRTTTGGDRWRSLADYVKDLKENQTAIYYALGETRDQVLASPQLEGYAARGLEVLVLTDPVDAFWVRTAVGYEGKPFRSVTQGAADLDAIPTVDAADAPSPSAEVAALVPLLTEALAGMVSDVRPSSRLATSPVCLVAPDFGLDKLTEKLMSRHEGGGFAARPILEINPAHPLVRALASRATAGDAAVVREMAPLLLGQARILDGEPPDDPAGFAKAVTRLLERQLEA